MRYKIDFDNTVNELVPHYLGGRNFILLLQALMKPLQTVNDLFVDWANETRIETSMTSQIFKFEWFLNRRFSQFFADSEAHIYIANKETLGVPFYSQNVSSLNGTSPILYSQTEDVDGKTVVLRMANEKLETSTYSFIVYVPMPDEKKISMSEYTSMIKYQIDKYKLSGKTYTMIFYSNK